MTPVTILLLDSKGRDVLQQEEAPSVLASGRIEFQGTHYAYNRMEDNNVFVFRECPPPIIVVRHRHAN